MFDRIHEFPDEQARRRLVPTGTQQFEISFIERSGAGELARHAVSDARVVDEWAEALASSFSALTGSRFGWRELDGGVSVAAAEMWRVKLKNLGPKILGAAIAGCVGMGGAESYLVLNVRALESSRPTAISRRRATVAHELCHLLQFETAAYRHWPAQGRWGLGDPNWWLHEASALAIEAALCDESPECYPLLWDWATTPSRSLDADDAGGFAAPLLMYLMRTLPDGDRLPADIYRVDPQAVPNMGGTDLLDHVLKSRGTRLAAASGEECFASRFCVDAAFVGTPGSVLDQRIHDVVGARAVTDVFDRFPLDAAATACPVDHLGCRYFQFRLPPASRGLRVTIRPQRPEGMNILRGELVLVGPDGRKLRQKTLGRVEDASVLSAEIPIDSQFVEFALLVVANCAWGAAANRCNEQTFSISATGW
jgi:hypothetical protein